MLTVVMATYNGAGTLPEVLNCYCRLESPVGGWKIIIVDNGSSDNTKEIVSSFSRSLPITYMFEAKRGKNAALNTGLARVSGDLVIFADDDALPNPRWLQQMRCAADSKPSFALFGGPLLPKWEVAPEDWLLHWVPWGPTFSLSHPMDEGPVRAEWVFGANMAVRSFAFERGHGFDESMGPKGSDYPMGSETELLIRLEKLGFKAWHVKDAVVKHIIRSYQMNLKWVLARAVRYGRGQYRLSAQVSVGPVRSYLGIPRRFWRLIFLQGLRVARAKLRADKEVIFKESWALNYLIGQATEARIMSKNAHSSSPGKGHHP